MSKAKHKYVVHEIDDLNIPTDSQCIVRILEPRGNNLHEVVNPSGEKYLVSMPTKFRRNIWVKRNDYVLTDPIKEGDKVKGEIVKILTKDHIKWYRVQNCWPWEFNEEDGHLKNYDDMSNNDQLFVNTNRWHSNRKIDNKGTSSSSESDSDSNSDSDSDSD